MKVHQNYVKLLGVMDNRKEAWKTSRPMFTEENLNFDKVAEMDLSLNSMLVFTLEMRSSVIFRDLIFSLRPLEGWALSTRSMPVSLDTVRLSSEFKDRPDEYRKIEHMFELLDEGKSRDQARGVLPITASSTYTFTMDFRVLMSFCKTIEAHNTRLFDEYCVDMLLETDTMEAYNRTSIGDCIEYYKIQDCEQTRGVVQAGTMMVGTYDMKMALASQFLRQHYSKIKIGLWNLIEHYYDMGMNQNSNVTVSFCIDQISYRKLMAMRSHWVIDWSPDMWGGLVGDYIKGMTAQEFWDFTPAGGDKDDPYWADCYNRVLLEDPGVPCPIMCEWRGALEHRRNEIGNNPILDMYERLFDEGFIKDNPENEHRVKYLALVEANGGMNDGYTREAS
jgi:hypothetical protein